MNIIVIFTISYLFMLIGVGFYLKKRVKTQEDFVVAGRTLTAPILVGTLMATWTGSGSIFSGGVLAYQNGYAALWSSFGAWLGILAVYLVAKKVRMGNNLSVPDILEGRYNKWASLVATLVTIIAYLVIVSYQFKAGGKVVKVLSGAQELSLFGMEMDPALLGILLTAVFAIGYTVLAGMMSVTYTDVINGVIMLFGILLALPFMLHKVGGWETFIHTVPAEKWQIFGTMGWTKAFGYLLPTMLLLMGDANMYQRLLSAKDEKEAKKSVIGWLLAVMLVEVLIVSLAFLGSAVETNLSDTQAESIILRVAMSHVPVMIGCLLFAAIVAIIVSTADSFLLVPATNLSHDIIQHYFCPQASEKKLVMINRLMVITLGIVALVLVSFFETILGAAYTAYTIYGVAITPVLIGGFLWKRASAAGAVTALLAGAIVTITWKIFGEARWEIAAVYPALATSLTCFISLSLLFPNKNSQDVSQAPSNL